ncbi:MAG: hypothetical protein ABI670_04225 [Chloroflexota bacterium]
MAQQQPLPDGGFAHPNFQRLWERTDSPVASSQAQRSWYWGPQPGQVKTEPYSGNKAGTRLVQYFDKARMEINNPDGDTTSEWFVTTGLLVAEMVSGKQQVGDKAYNPLQPAEIAVGGDGLTADADAPTYTSFRPVASLKGPGSNRAPDRTGQSVSATINRAGQVGDNPALALFAGAQLAAYNDVLGHNIPRAMWDFLNLKGLVKENGKMSDGQTLANWIFVMGYPITEPYWARVKIDGIYYDALFQMYERRSLAYIPSFPKGWQVQMGNVGVHYYRWIYGGPLPTTLVPSARGIPSKPPLPPSVDAEISPQAGPIGASFAVSLTDFRPAEDIVSWFTSPDGAATDAKVTVRAAAGGTAVNVALPTAGLSPGVWAVTFHGKASNHESIAYFFLYEPDPFAPTPTHTATTVATATATATVTAQATSSAVVPAPTRTSTPRPQGTVSPTATYPPVPTEPAGGLVIGVRPRAGPPDGQFTFTATGLVPNEPVQVKFTDPNRTKVYPNGSNGGQYQADPSGALSFTLVPTQAFPAAPTGNWLFELRGQQSGLEGVTGFVLR